MYIYIKQHVAYLKYIKFLFKNNSKSKNADSWRGDKDCEKCEEFK